MAIITSNSITFIDNTGAEKYLYIRYSNDGATFTENNGLTPGDWLGTCTTSSTTAPTDFNAYQWSKIKGEDGKDATIYYTWIKYADDVNGTNMSDSPDDKTYMGIAYNKESSNESDNPKDYTWSLIKGSNGIDGDNGITYYTWVKYADDNIGSGISDDPAGKEYIGIAYNKLDVNESDDPNDYTWSLFKGKDGIDGENGTAGKGIVSISEYYLISPNNSGITTETLGWSLDVPTLDKENKYLWNYEVTEFTTGEVDTTEPVIIGVYGDGISSIINYYAVTSELVTPEEWIKEIPPAISSVNKYLWNYEEIRYTDGSSTKTEPAVIGVRGDNGIDGVDGTNAVDFQIYSVDGFEFTDNVSEIKLKTIAFFGGAKLETEDVSYQWKWWNAESELDDKYEEISNETSSELIVNINDAYAFASIKCEMTYDGIVYEDYVSLTQKTVVYTAAAKFFNGNNTISTDNDYLIVYIELYKENKSDESLYTNSAYKSDSNIVQDNLITTDLSGEYVNGDMMYFICKNTYDDVVEYNVALGRYESNQWHVVPSKYTYKNDLFAYTKSPVVFVPKEKIPKSLTINFEVYKDNAIVARTNAMVLDFNDPTVSNSAPINPQEGQLWLDTSVSPSILKMWDGTEWVNSGYQNGNVVYTSKPTDGYSRGDLWILADGEICGDFGPGSMLKATTTSSTFNESHWVDVDKESTALKENIKQYFLFNKDTGLRIGQSDDKFYVNISSTEMGFYDATSGAAEKVVSISNQSATIQNTTLKGNTNIYGQINICNPEADPDDNTEDSLFIWKIEKNGSLSLAIAT